MALKKLFRKKTPQLKQTVTVTQENHILSIQGALSNPKFTVLGILFSLRDDEETVYFSNELSNHQFQFNIDLAEHVDAFTDEESVYNVFIKVRTPESELKQTQINLLKTKAS